MISFDLSEIWYVQIKQFPASFTRANEVITYAGLLQRASLFTTSFIGPLVKGFQLVLF